MRGELEESHHLRQTRQITITRAPPKKLRLKRCVELFCREALHSQVPSLLSKQGKHSYRHIFIGYGLKRSDSGELTYHN